ncbi:MmcQ/YjbR family DNA-binding protein [Zavarzinia sp. CC-PAN008]|uniref:MmcQ/YjbR family DNA-binding protein n=1 Tax=Zavarzinia sp. CC-PAN008 TaxID=3243332 RepID=UPI003F74A855
MATPDDLRRLALAQPDAVESSHMGTADFRVKGRIFATLHAEAGHAVVKLDPMAQEALCAAEPAALSPVPGAWGAKGWTRIHLDASDEALVADLLARAHGLVTAGAKRSRRRSPP